MDKLVYDTVRDRALLEWHLSPDCRKPLLSLNREGIHPVCFTP